MTPQLLAHLCKYDDCSVTIASNILEQACLAKGPTIWYGTETYSPTARQNQRNVRPVRLSPPETSECSSQSATSISRRQRDRLTR